MTKKNTKKYLRKLNNKSKTKLLYLDSNIVNFFKFSDELKKGKLFKL
jgi:hypothetical protein